MKRNWSKFFTQYTVLLVVGTLVISGSLLYIDNKDKLTPKSANLQEPKSITIKKTYKDNILISEYNDEDYNFEEQSNEEQSDNGQDNSHETSYPNATTHATTKETSSPNATTHATTKETSSRPENKLSVKTYTKTTTTKKTTNQKRGLNARNPHAREYANAIKEYQTMAARAKELKANKRTANSDDRYKIDNELRQMKAKQINLESKVKRTQKKYRAWESRH